MELIFIIPIAFFLTVICLTPALKKYIDKLVFINPFFKSQMLWGTIIEMQDTNNVIPNLLCLGRQPISIVTYNCGGEIKKVGLLQCQGDEVGKKILLAVNQHNTNVAVRTTVEEPIKKDFYIYFLGLYYILTLCRFGLRSMVKHYFSVFILLVFVTLMLYFLFLPKLLTLMEKSCMQSYYNKISDSQNANFVYKAEPLKDINASRENTYVAIIIIISSIIAFIMIFFWIFFVY